MLERRKTKIETKRKLPERRVQVRRENSQGPIITVVRK